MKKEKTLQQKHEAKYSKGMNAYRRDLGSKEYAEGWDRIFNKNSKKVEHA